MGSSVHIELMNVSFRCLVNTGVSMCWSPWKNVSYVFVLSSPAMSCSSYLGEL